VHWQGQGWLSWSQSFEPRYRTWSEGIEPLSEHETQQFLRHAARVRYLSIRQTKNHLDLLTAFPIEARIFPRLLALNWDPDTNAWVHLFLSPTLRRCALQAVHSDFKSICLPGLENLSFWSYLDRDDFRASDVSLLSEAVRSCRQLKHLRCSSLDSAAWKHLSNLPNFATLLMYGALNEPTLDLDGVTLTPFLNITSLFFRLDSAVNIITILQHSKFPSLKKFIVHVDAIHCSEAEQLCHALAQCNTCHTLQYVSIHSFNPTDEHPDKALVVIKPFFCLPQLRDLKLNLSRSIYLDNDLLLEAMSSWPHIHDLHLDSTSSRYDNPPSTNTVTFRGLFAALRLCPHLFHLSLDMDATNIDIDIECETFQHTSLKYLDVGSSIAEDPEAIIRIISTMLPSVRGVRHCGGRGGVWSRVDNVIANSCRRPHVCRRW